ncbi:MAG TPA: MerR family transcriptional regulator [Streptosporangiaceae bacterium]
MRISELSDRSGLTVQTIKFYLREGLLPKGTATSTTRAYYDERHLRRLRLIRALREVGDLPIAAITRIVTALDDEKIELPDLLGIAQHALGPYIPPGADGAAWRAAKEDVDSLVAELGWLVGPDAPARDLLAQTFLALRGLGFPIVLTELRPYIDAAAAISAHETARLAPDAPRERALLGTLVTTVLYEQVLIALHRLAQEDASARRFGNGGAS